MKSLAGQVPQVALLKIPETGSFHLLRDFLWGLLCLGISIRKLFCYLTASKTNMVSCVKVF